MVWYNYLFYDTSISVEGTISTNFGLPLQPAKLQVGSSEFNIKVNCIIYGLATKIYSNEPDSLTNLDNELMRARDIMLLERAMKGAVASDELVDLDQKIAKMVQVRIQKFELEGETDPWIQSIQKYIAGNSPLNPDPLKEVKMITEEDDHGINQQTEEAGMHRHEFIESDSDSEKDDDEESHADRFKADLSKIEEERTEQLQPSTHNENPGENSLSFKSQIGSNATLRLLGLARPRNEPINTAGTDARSHTDYITQDNAMKSYIHKSLMAGLGDRIRKSSLPLNAKMKQSSLDPQFFASEELESTLEHKSFYGKTADKPEDGSDTKTTPLPLPREEENYVGKNVDPLTPTLYKRHGASKIQGIVEENCSLSSDEVRSRQEQQLPKHGS